MAETTENQPQDASERRLFRRIGTRVEGRIVFAGVDVDCIVHEMSATGALIECLPPPALGAAVAIDVPDVGFARGTVIRHDGELACIELSTPTGKRMKLTDRLILAAFRNPPEDRS